MQTLIEHLKEGAMSDDLRRSLQIANRSPILQRFCVATSDAFAHKDLVATWFVVADDEGDKTIWADTQERGVDFNVSAREYVQNAFDPSFPHEVFVSEIYLAKSDDLYKYAVVSRVRGADGKILGLLAASIAPESSKAYMRQEKLIRELILWTGIALAPMAILLIATLCFAAHRSARHNPIHRRDHPATGLRR